MFPVIGGLLDLVKKTSMVFTLWSGTVILHARLFESNWPYVFQTPKGFKLARLVNTYMPTVYVVPEQYDNI